MINILFSLLFTLIIVPGFLKGQAAVSKNMERCAKPKFEDKCIKKKLPPSDYIYLSSWDCISADSINIKFPVILKRNVSYVFIICEGSGNENMVLNLSDSDDNLLSSTENKKTKKIEKAIYFRPKASGKFYFSTFFDKEEQDCCLIMQFICGMKNFKTIK